MILWNLGMIPPGTAPDLGSMPTIRSPPIAPFYTLTMLRRGSSLRESKLRMRCLVNLDTERASAVRSTIQWLLMDTCIPWKQDILAHSELCPAHSSEKHEFPSLRFLRRTPILSRGRPTSQIVQEFHCIHFHFPDHCSPQYPLGTGWQSNTDMLYLSHIETYTPPVQLHYDIPFKHCKHFKW